MFLSWVNEYLTQTAVHTMFVGIAERLAAGSVVARDYWHQTLIGGHVQLLSVRDAWKCHRTSPGARATVLGDRACNRRQRLSHKTNQVAQNRDA